MKNILTVDVEEYYHALFSQRGPIEKGRVLEDRVLEFLNILVDLIAQKDSRATFFVVGELAKKHPEAIRRIVQEGHEIGVHSFSHKRVCEMTPAEFIDDLRRSRREICRLTRKSPVSYRAPAFSMRRNMLWAFRILSEEGFQYDSSLFPTVNPLYGDINASVHPHIIEETDFRIKEFPLTTLNILGLPMPVAGGFYLRVLPVWIIAYSVKRCNREGAPFVLYVHPWELDPQQPRPSGLTLLERITHYYNLDRTLEKLEYLLDRYQFTSIVEFEGGGNSAVSQQ